MTGDRDIPKRWQGIEPDGVAKQGVVHDRHRTDKYDVFGSIGHGDCGARAIAAPSRPWRVRQWRR